ncbi:hypothetical protein FACS1894166_04770 [Bacilli bacterium]|nr:hypothetical protein FACS1894166_04770 [Bacilli bacterium]
MFTNDIENDRYVEIWNIVFSQYNNDGKNNYIELARKNIDTGAGLERLACISQDKHTDFDTDGFAPIIKKIEILTNVKYDENIFFDKQSPQFLVNKDFKIIADHIKACTFAIADGAIPSGKDRGYVLRKLIRRAMVSAKRLNINKNFLTNVADSVIQTMSHSYPYLLKEKTNIARVLEKEESLFLTTLSKGYELFEDSLQNKMIDTETLFKLVDTYGFPFEIINELAEAKHVKLDIKSFNERFKKHQEISRSSADIKGMLSQNADLVSFNAKSEFDYDHLEIKNTKVVACFDENLKSVKELDGKG